MGTEFANSLQQPSGGMMGPSPQAAALNSPTPEMQNIARGQDPTANGLGSIRPSAGGMGGGKPSGPPPQPRVGFQPVAPGPGTLDAGTPAGGPGGQMAIAQLLASLKRGGPARRFG